MIHGYMAKQTSELATARKEKQHADDLIKSLRLEERIKAISEDGGTHVLFEFVDRGGQVDLLVKRLAHFGYKMYPASKIGIKTENLYVIDWSEAEDPNPCYADR
jgi:hypothetical protein